MVKSTDIPGIPIISKKRSDRERIAAKRASQAAAVAASGPLKKARTYNTKHPLPLPAEEAPAVIGKVLVAVEPTAPPPPPPVVAPPVEVKYSIYQIKRLRYLAKLTPEQHQTYLDKKRALAQAYYKRKKAEKEALEHPEPSVVVTAP